MGPPRPLPIIWSPRSLERVEEAAAFIASDDVAAAARWVDELFDRVALAATAPLPGREVPEAGRAEIREVYHGQYRVIYRVDPKQIIVLTVRHGRRRFDLDDVTE